MIRIVLYAVAALLGMVYAIFPRWFLKNKSADGKVTDSAVKTARVSGIVVAVIGAVLAVMSAVQA